MDQTPALAVLSMLKNRQCKEEAMANASSKHIGSASQGKLSGTGAMTDIDKDKLPENMVLSNRDKAQHSRERGLDGKAIQNEQFHDQDANRLTDE
jgi:hypothetical protein